MERIGGRIKRKREQLSMQLNDLARRVGISSSALSQIEKAKSFPSIVTLKLIAEQLHTTVGELVGENEPETNHPVCRHDEKTLIGQNASNAQMYLLSQQMFNRHIDPFLVRFDHKSNSIDLFKSVSGYVYGYVLKGEIQFELDNRSYVLQPGDSIYFSSRRNYLFQNLAEDESQMLFVFSAMHL